jgi:tetratricopeptide (TPR) repeat protein
MSGPTKAEIYFKLHKHALSDGDPEMALAFIEKANTEDPTNFDYAFGIVKARLEQKAPPHVSIVFKDVERAFLCDPTRKDTYDFITSLTFNNKMKEFDQWIERALVAFPEDENFLNLAGVNAMNKSDYSEARKYFQKCLAINPLKAENHYNCGVTYVQNLDFIQDVDDKSIWHFKTALTIRPEWLLARQALAGSYTRQSKFKETLTIDSEGDVVIDALKLESRWRSGDMKNVASEYETVIARATAGGDRNVIGSIIKNQTGYFEAAEDIQRAEKAYRYIYEHRDDYFDKGSFMYKDVALGTGHFLSKIGKWDEAMPMICESIISPQKGCDYPMWEGNHTDHLVIFNNELGNGDQMFYSRYIPLAAERADKVTIVVIPRLKHMYKNLSGKYNVVVKGDPIEGATEWIQCSYLIKFFGPQPMWDFLPAPPPPPSATGKALLHLSSSKINPLLNYRRDVPFSVCKSILDSGDYSWVSVAKQDGAHKNLTDLSENIDKGTDGFIDTMKILAEVDVVVTCDTFMAHLAGLLKRPTILILTTMAEFRWGSKVYEYDWYPTVKYVRQKAWGDWDGISDEISKTISNEFRSS